MTQRERFDVAGQVVERVAVDVRSPNRSNLDPRILNPKCSVTWQRRLLRDSRVWFDAVRPGLLLL